MALAPFMPRMDSGMLQDDFFGGLMPFLGGMGTGVGPLASLATTGTRPLYVDVSEGENSYDLKADVPGACRCRGGCEWASQGAARSSLNGVKAASLTSATAGVKKDNIQLEAEGQILRIRRVAREMHNPRRIL